MKLLAAFGLLALALASWQPADRLYDGPEKAFRVGKSYTFNYQGQIAHGLPVKGSSSHSIQHGKSKVIVTVGDKYWTLRMDDIRLSHGQRKIEEPRVFDNMISLEESELSEEKREILSLPVRFRVHNGIISELHFSERDNTWSENLKRGLVQMLQIKFSPKTQEFNDVTETENKFFTQPERMLEGECEVSYSVVEGLKREEKEVTKAVNFDKCTKRADFRYGFRFTSECTTCESQDSRPESQTIYNYKVVGDEKEYLIKEVSVKSEYAFAPLAKEEEALATYMHTIMRLIKVEEAERQSEPKWGPKSSLLYNHEEEMAREQFWMNGDEESWKLAKFDKIPKIELVEKYISQLINSIEESEKDGVKLESTHYMARIAIVLRMCNRAEMMEVHEKVCESNKFGKNQKKVNEIMADCLAIAGTKVTVEHLVEKIEKKQISPLKASLTLKSLVNAPVSSEKIVDAVLRLGKSKQMRDEPVLRQSAMLTAGALMNTLCGRNTEQWAIELEGERRCTREQKTQWLATLKNLYTESSSKYEKVLVLKTLANSGMDVAVHFIQDIIYNKSEEPVIRSSAIDALRMLREEMPRKIQSILLPLFKARREPLALRMSAVYQLIHSRPALPILEQIVDTLNREHNHQLRSFCYSLMNSFTESQNPCEKKMSEDLTVALRNLRFRPTLESRYVRASAFWRKLDLGLSFDMASIFTNESILPTELLANFDSLFAGQWNKHLGQLGLTQQNLDRVLYQLINKYGKSFEESSEVVTRGQRSSKINNILKELASEMKIVSRRAERDAEPFGMLYLRYKNLDYAVVPVEEKLIDEITRNGVSSMADLIRDLARGIRFDVSVASFLYERTRTVVSHTGLPTHITQKMPTIATIKGEIKFEMSTRPTLVLKAEPSVASTHVTEMVTIHPSKHTGARLLHSVQATLPIDMSLTYDYEREQLKASFRTPKEQKRVLLVETRPLNFIRTFSQRYSPLVSEKTMTVPRLQRSSVHYEREFGRELTGFNVEVFGTVHRRAAEEQVNALLYGENHVQVIVVPTEEATKEIVFEIEPKWNAEKKNFEGPTYDQEFESKDFRMEDSEEDNLYEPENKRSARHQETRKYYQEKPTDKTKEGRMLVKVYTVGGPKELKGQMEFIGQCDREVKQCRLEIIAKRSPLTEEETREWEMNCKVEIVMPKGPKSIRELREQKHREIQATINLRWGANEKNTIQLRVQAEQDREMQKLVRGIIVREEKEEKEGLEQLEVLKEAARLNKVSILINHDLSKKNEKLFEQRYSLIKANYYLQSSVEQVRRNKGSILVKLTVEPKECRRVNLTLETSEERLTVESLKTPIRLPLPTIFKSSSINVFNKIVRATKTATCEVRSNKVSTFDRVTYKAPMTNCYTVLAKDCSEEPEYAVLMKTVRKNSEEKQIKIVRLNKEIEVELKEDELIVKVDGRRVRDEELLRESGIEMIGERSVEITLPKITVRFDGYKCEVKADKRTENKQCGMCGHFDGNRDNEFRRADNQETDDIEEFHRSWLRKDSECEMEENKLKEKKNYGMEEREEKNYETESSEEDYERVKVVKKAHQNIQYRDEDNETYEPERKTMILERESKTCFSSEPVNQCRPDDEAVEKKEKKIRFSCLPRNDREAKEMREQIKRGKDVTDKVEELKVSFSETIRVPTLCRVY
ncbi:unnamed protein product, partial [Mesorhabditis spiculigera]